MYIFVSDNHLYKQKTKEKFTNIKQILLVIYVYLGIIPKIMFKPGPIVVELRS